MHDDSIDKLFLQPRHDSRVHAFNDGDMATFIMNESSRLSRPTGFVPIQEEEEEEAFSLRLRPRRFRPGNPVSKVHERVEGVVFPEQEEMSTLPSEASSCPTMTPKPLAQERLLTTPPALIQRASNDGDCPSVEESSFLPISAEVLMPML
jgi:hypothetical protein